ncbi:MAG: hypothetical protein HY253_14080 [Burkholderiales bacterium]|nr:hypothetical protein [Burkholderiales bacterium]
MPHRFLCLLLFSLMLVLITGCERQLDKAVARTPETSIPKRSYPIVFVTQVPLDDDKNTRLSAFANHRSSTHDVPRGGDLMLWSPDGSLRNLTQEAGLGQDGEQAEKAIAVREPSVHPDGDKIIVSLLTGSPTAQNPKLTTWQLYEVSQLEKTQQIRFHKIPHQDPRYHYLSPLYADDGDLIFTSDRPRTGEPHLHPQLDEYEATPSVTGIWKMNRETGKLTLLSHTPSGAFTPIIDQFGRIIFTRWDHLQQDQLADRDRDADHNGVALPFHSFNFSDESAHAKKLPSRAEFFPESRVGSQSVFGPVSAFRNNFFTPWQIDQDGGNEETLNHIGQHELSAGALTPSFSQDPQLTKQVNMSWRRNRLAMRSEGGLFHIKEDPLEAGTFYAINARESASFTTDSIVKILAPPQRNPEDMELIAVTAPNKSDRLPEGRYRNPLPLSDGRLIASHTSAQLPPTEDASLPDLRLRFLSKKNGATTLSPDTYLTTGIHKKLSWWDGQQIRHFEGKLWELDPVELRPRQITAHTKFALEAPEKHVLQEVAVNEQDLRNWLTERKLALVITRNQTQRDRADQQQPYNLRVPGGVATIAAAQNGDKPAKVYDISHFQILQAEQIRAYPDRPGRRNLAQAIPALHPLNQADRQIQGAVHIAADGSTAAFVPAERALSWQTTDAAGNAVVRERNWVTFKSGEIRTCAACHGINRRNQANFPAPVNPPQALRELLQNWKKSLNQQQNTATSAKTPKSNEK